MSTICSVLPKRPPHPVDDGMAFELLVMYFPGLALSAIIFAGAEGGAPGDRTLDRDVRVSSGALLH